MLLIFRLALMLSDECASFTDFSAKRYSLQLLVKVPEYSESVKVDILCGSFELASLDESILWDYYCKATPSDKHYYSAPFAKCQV